MAIKVDLIELMPTLLFLFAAAATLAPAHAEDSLPYATRTRLYSGWSTGVHGDIRTVGMAGATMGLADTFIAAADNPAGLAMTMNTGDTNFTSNSIHDGYVQNYSSVINTNNFGAALSIYPWGFALGYISRYREEQRYLVPGYPDDPANLANTTRGIHLSAARVFAENRFSLGLNLVVGQSETEIEFSRASGAGDVNHSYGIGVTLGGMYQFSRRLMLGVGFSPPMNYGGREGNKAGQAIPGFFQTTAVPMRVGAGLGWIPNRFLRADASVFLVGTTRGAALLRDDSTLVGQRVTLQPRMGLAYTFADFHDFSGTAFFGSYYEVPRIEANANRYHGTAGVEGKVWVISAGAGFDVSAAYTNYIASIGVDVFKVMEKTDIIPTPWRPPHEGLFPRPTVDSDHGLARPLVKEWKPEGTEIDPIQVGLDIPGKLRDKATKTGKDIMRVGEKVFETIGDIPGKLVPKKKPKFENHPAEGR